MAHRNIQVVATHGKKKGGGQWDSGTKFGMKDGGNEKWGKEQGKCVGPFNIVQ